MDVAPRIYVFARDSETDDEARFRRAIKERAECVDKRASAKERHKTLRNIGSKGIRSHHEGSALRLVFAR
jgi:hypothetical protein